MPIPGTTKMHRWRRTSAGADVDLTADDLSSLADLLAQVPVTGERYTPAMQASIDR